MEKTKKAPLFIPAAFFSVFLLLFPIDSALGEWLGTVSVNNYVAIATVISILIFAPNRIYFKRDSFLTAYLFYVLYQFICMTYGGNMFSNRNIIFIFYSIMALLVLSTQWTKQELFLFKLSIVCSIVLACGIIFSRINFSSSGRLYLSLSRNIDQNYLCSNLIFGTALLANSFLKETKRLYKFFFASILIWEMICILYLGSRGGLLGNLAVIFIIFITNARQLSRSLFSIFVILITLLLFISIMDFALPQWMLNRFTLANMVADGGSGRTTLWRMYLTAYANGTFAELLFGFGRGAIYNFVSYGRNVNCTHSIYVKALFEGGLVGFTMMLTMLGLAIRKTIRVHANALTAIIVGYCVCGAFLDLDDYRIFPLMIMLIFLYVNSAYSVTRGEKDGFGYRSDL